ncbi:hypothetical protein PDIP_72030 [Penicillium digitatum Pd1]|uniref:Uncharacterized protein n=1 Tax=Penicillium digitatum (strain Pd1 / CECT 20795) TaxID=1170230 RepID=K9FEJ5_PEND1|nr:hypothetical protein PDIP_72030 [Penicillium digitatum Pd1]EKV07825.1 hypothetical protein PDIP_72030 [Penicillium digitatum Pd1]
MYIRSQYTLRTVPSFSYLLLQFPHTGTSGNHIVLIVTKAPKEEKKKKKKQRRLSDQNNALGGET